MKIKTILIVEDKPEEQGKALEAIKSSSFAEEKNRTVHEGEFTGVEIVLEDRSRPGNITRVWLTKNYSEAVRLLTMEGSPLGRDSVGVITDMMFPRIDGGEERPYGMAVMTDCIGEKLPVVICSDTNGHDLAWMLGVIPLLEKLHTVKIPMALGQKDWKRAIYRLLEISE